MTNPIPPPPREPDALFVPFDPKTHKPGFYWVQCGDDTMPVHICVEGLMHGAIRGRSLHSWTPSDRYLFGPRIPSPDELSALVAPPFKTPLDTRHGTESDYVVDATGGFIHPYEIADYINAQAELHARFGTKNEETT